MSPYFSLLDLVVFFLVLGILAGIWTFNLYVPKPRPWDSLSPSGQDVPVVVAALSTASNLTPTLVIVGFVVEVYLHGTELFFLFGAFFITTVVAAHCYIPVFFGSGVKSSFEYIGRRFGIHIRRCFTFLVFLQNILFIPFLLSTPLIIFQHVTTINLWRTSIIFGILLLPVILFNNIRASAMNDALTFSLTVITLIAVTSLGANDVGGFGHAWNVSYVGSRKFFKFIEDKYCEHSLWSILIGGSIMWSSLGNFNPPVVDRYLAVSNQRKSQIATWLSLPCFGFVIIATMACGIVSFTLYQLNCDRLHKNKVHYEEIVSYMMIKYESTGLTGFFTSAIVSGSIGLVGSILSTTAEAMMEEILRPFKVIKEEYRKIFLWILEIILTGLCVYLVTVVLNTINSTMKSGLTIFSIIGAPLLGMFTLALFIPWTNKLGVFCGLIVGLSMATWLTVGKFLNDSSFLILTSMLDGKCQNFNSTATFDTRIPRAIMNPIASYNRSSIIGSINVSYFWISPIAFASTVFSALIISLLTGRTDPDDLDTTLLHPGISYLIRNFQIPCSFKRRNVFFSSSSSEDPLRSQSRIQRISSPIIYV